MSEMTGAASPSLGSTLIRAAHVDKEPCASIGVVIPVYNRPRLIVDAIDCVIAQSRRPQRLVIVDDGSTDATAANIEKHLAERPPPFEVRLVRQERSGVSAARNRAVHELEECDILAMIDSDDLWPSDYLERMSQPLMDDAAAAATFCDQRFVDTQTGDSRHRDLAIYATQTTRRMFLYGPPTPSCTVLRGDLFRRLGGYDQTLTCSEDYDLHLRLSLEGRWVHVPGIEVQIRRATGVNDVTAHHLTEIRDRCIVTQRIVMLERFVRVHGGARRMTGREWRTALGRQWIQHGRALASQGSVGEAAWCYQRALRAAPWLVAGWTGYTSTRLRRSATPPPTDVDAVHAPV